MNDALIIVLGYILNIITVFSIWIYLWWNKIERGDVIPFMFFMSFAPFFSVLAIILLAIIRLIDIIEANRLVNAINKFRDNCYNKRKAKKEKTNEFK